MGDILTDFEQNLRRLGKDVQSFVDQFAVEQEQDFKPQADIIDSTDEYVILLDLPGFSKDEITLALKDQVLRISGNRVIEISEHETYKRRERSTGSFTRSFALPEEVKTSDIKAKFDKGVLKITLPKSDSLDDATSIPID